MESLYDFNTTPKPDNDTNSNSIYYPNLPLIHVIWLGKTVDENRLKEFVSNFKNHTIWLWHDSRLWIKYSLKHEVQLRDPNLPIIVNSKKVNSKKIKSKKPHWMKNNSQMVTNIKNEKLEKILQNIKDEIPESHIKSIDVCSHLYTKSKKNIYTIFDLLQEPITREDINLLKTKYEEEVGIKDRIFKNNRGKEIRISNMINWGMGSDILRYVILSLVGGLYLDLDIIKTNKTKELDFSNLITESCAGFLSGSPGEENNNIIYVPANKKKIFEKKIIPQLCINLENLRSDSYYDYLCSQSHWVQSTIEKTGPGFLRPLLEAYNNPKIEGLEEKTAKSSWIYSPIFYLNNFILFYENGKDILVNNFLNGINKNISILEFQKSKINKLQQLIIKYKSINTNNELKSEIKKKIDKKKQKYRIGTGTISLQEQIEFIESDLDTLKDKLNILNSQNINDINIYIKDWFIDIFNLSSNYQNIDQIIEDYMEFLIKYNHEKIYNINPNFIYDLKKSIEDYIESFKQFKAENSNNSKKINIRTKEINDILSKEIAKFIFEKLKQNLKNNFKNQMIYEHYQIPGNLKLLEGIIENDLNKYKNCEEILKSIEQKFVPEYVKDKFKDNIIDYIKKL